MFEEIVANIVRHGAPHRGELHIEVQLERAPHGITMSFADDGIPFDPSTHSDPAPATSLAEARDGGFGLKMVRHAVAALHYRRTPDGKNIVVLALPDGHNSPPGRSLNTSVPDKH